MNEFEINGRRSLAPVKKQKKKKPRPVQVCKGGINIWQSSWRDGAVSVWFYGFLQEDAFKEELALIVLWHVNHPLNNDEKSAIHITRVQVCTPHDKGAAAVWYNNQEKG